MHRRHREAAAGQGGRDLVGGPLGLAEHHRQAAVPGLQHAGQHLDLVHLVRPEHVLPGLGGGGRLVVALGPDVGRLPHVAAGQRDDVPGHGRGEQHGLAPVRGELDDPLHVGQEPEVEHLVGFVEHEGANRAQVKVAALGQVEQPAGGADDDVDAGRQRVDLRLVGPAAVDGEHARAHVDRGDAQVVGDLDGQFPGGHDHEGQRRARRGLSDQLKQRNAEREGLSGAGPGLPDDVLPAQGQRQGERLDGKGSEEARGLQAGDDLFADVEITERDGLRVTAGLGTRQGRHRPGRRGGRLGLVPAKSLSCQGFHPSSWPSPAVPGLGPSCTVAACGDPPRCELRPCS